MCTVLKLWDQSINSCFFLAVSDATDCKKYLYTVVEQLL